DHVGSLILPGERDIFAISRHGWLYHQPIAGLDRVDDGIEQAHSPAVKKVIPLRGDGRSTQANENHAGEYIDFSHRRISSCVAHIIPPKARANRGISAPPARSYRVLNIVPRPSVPPRNGQRRPDYRT